MTDTEEVIKSSDEILMELFDSINAVRPDESTSSTESEEHDQNDDKEVKKKKVKKKKEKNDKEKKKKDKDDKEKRRGKKKKKKHKHRKSSSDREHKKSGKHKKKKRKDEEEKESEPLQLEKEEEEQIPEVKVESENLVEIVERISDIKEPPVMDTATIPLPPAKNEPIKPKDEEKSKVEGLPSCALRVAEVFVEDLIESGDQTTVKSLLIPQEKPKMAIKITNLKNSHVLEIAEEQAKLNAEKDESGELTKVRNTEDRKSVSSSSKRSSSKSDSWNGLKKRSSSRENSSQEKHKANSTEDNYKPKDKKSSRHDKLKRKLKMTDNVKEKKIVVIEDKDTTRLTREKSEELQTSPERESPREIKKEKSKKSCRRKRSKSKDSPVRERRSRSKDRKSSPKRKRSGSKERTKRSKSKDKKSMERARSREPKCSKKRSRSRSKGRKRSRSRSKSKDGKRSKESERHKRQSSKERRKSKERDKRSRSKDREDAKKLSRKDSTEKGKNLIRSKSSDRKRSRSRSRSRNSHQKKESSGEKRHSRRSRSPRKSKHRTSSRGESKDEFFIDKSKLLEIARKNALSMMKQGQVGTDLNKVAAITAGGKTVDELTDFCKLLSQKEATGQESISSESSSENESERPFHHPFQLKERPNNIVMNIRNCAALPVKSHQEKTTEHAQQLRLQFPVSSGQHHRKTESDWVPVGTKTNELKAIMPPPPPEEPPQSFPVAKEPLPHPDNSAQSFANIPLPPSAPPYMDSSVQFQNNYAIGAAISERLAVIRKQQEAMSSLPAGTFPMDMMNKQMHIWPGTDSPVGLFTGSTGARVLTQAELASGQQAWARKDQLISAQPVSGGMGMSLLQKMGWKPGEGLGKNNEGSLEPLKLQVKMDKRGLVCAEELPRRQRLPPPPMKINHNANKPSTNAIKSNEGKHPVSLLIEYCTRRHYPPPVFTVCSEEGPAHKKNFVFKVTVNGMDYLPTNPSPNKKLAKSEAATLCLRKLGLLPIVVKL